MSEVQRERGERIESLIASPSNDRGRLPSRSVEMSSLPRKSLELASGGGRPAPGLRAGAKPRTNRARFSSDPPHPFCEPNTDELDKDVPRVFPAMLAGDEPSPKRPISSGKLVSRVLAAKPARIDRLDEWLRFPHFTASQTRAMRPDRVFSFRSVGRARPSFWSSGSRRPAEVTRSSQNSSSPSAVLPPWQRRARWIFDL